MKPLTSLSIILFCISGLFYPDPASQGERRTSETVLRADGLKFKKQYILREFDGRHRPGSWDIHQYPGVFRYSCSRKELIMDGSQGQNQHITRRGILINPARPYAIEVEFMIDEPDDAPVPNSFCINFNIAGNDGELDSITCWAMNLDIAPTGKQPAGVMKTMGFVGGRYQQIKPSHPVNWCRMRTFYTMILHVNKNSDGLYMRNKVAVRVYEGDECKDSFETDYSPFSYQVDYSNTVRIGLNTHGANWIVKNMKVCYLD